MLVSKKLASLLVVSFVVACGGDEDAPPAPPAAAQPPNVAPPGPAAPAQPAPPPPTTPSEPGPTTPGPTGPAAGGCDAKNLCLDVASIRQGKTPLAGRLALIWMPPAGGAVEVAHDVAFLGTETRVTIPLANVTVPTDAAVSCTRQCETPAACPCTSEFKMAYGMVVVVSDTDGDGKASTDDEVLGVSDATVLYSATALKPPPEGFTWSGRPMSEAFPSGVEQGANAYTTAGDKLTPAAAGSASKLQVCDTLEQEQCSVGPAK